MKKYRIPMIKEAGKLRVLNKTLLDRVTLSIPEGKKLIMVIEPEEQITISDNMRKYYWTVVMAMIAEETGHSRDMVHDAMKIKIVGYVDEKTGLTIVPSVFSNESQLDLTEKWEFISEVRRWAFDFLNLSIPDPEKVVP